MRTDRRHGRPFRCTNLNKEYHQSEKNIVRGISAEFPFLPSSRHMCTMQEYKERNASGERTDTKIETFRGRENWKERDQLYYTSDDQDGERQRSVSSSEQPEIERLRQRERASGSSSNLAKRSWPRQRSGQDSEYFAHFQLLVIRGYLEARKHASKFLLLLEILSKQSRMACWAGGVEASLEALRGRFNLDKSEEQCVEHAYAIIEQSINNWRTVQYDSYQRITNGSAQAATGGANTAQDEGNNASLTRHDAQPLPLHVRMCVCCAIRYLIERENPLDQPAAAIAFEAPCAPAHSPWRAAL